MGNDETRRAADDQEINELGAIVGWAFGSPVPKAIEWLKKGGVENARVLRSEGRVLAGLLEIPMGQWFLGRSVPMLGIAGVAVSPDARGRGVALGMMQSTLRQARERGLALSALYPATETLYRAVGYELAGAYCRYSMRASDCPREKSELRVSLVTPEQQPELGELYTEVARLRSGYLDRGPFAWKRVRQPHDEVALGVVVQGPARIEGYAYMSQRSSTSADYDLLLSDLVARTPQALSRLLTFLADHRTTAGNIVWHAGPADASLLTFKEAVFEVGIEKYWMLRVVDVKLALELRGYPAIDSELTLRIDDDLLPENSGTYRLGLQGGSASVDRVNGAAVKLGPRALAALYSGFLSAEELARAGMLSADPSTLAKLSLVFGGPAPAMSDYF